MKRKIRTPYFEIGTKNYIYGDKVLDMCKKGRKNPPAQNVPVDRLSGEGDYLFFHSSYCSM